MTVNSQRLLLAAAGAGGAAAGVLYVDDVFSTYLYTGNGSTQTITNGIDLSGEGGLIWFKRRDAVGNNTLTDTVDNKRLITDSTNAQNPNALVSSFNSDGFSLNTSLTPNQSGSDYCSWTFRKAPGFFDVVTYTGNGTAGRTVSHNLGSVPGMIIVKKTNSTGNWAVYHRSLGNSNAIYLHTTGASFSSPLFNNTTPTSTEFTLNNGGDVNGNGNTYVAYLFAHDDAQFGENEDESIIKCGSYTGSASDQQVDLGFEPQWLLLKNADDTTSWFVKDNMRGLINWLKPNSNAAEVTNLADTPEFNSTGFTVYGNSGSNFSNSNANTYVYVAIRRPHKPPEAGTDVFAADKEVSPTYSKTFTSGFPVDLTVTTLTSATSSKYWLNRVTGTSDRLVSNSNAAAFTGQDNGDFDRMDGWYESIGIGGDAISWMFRRAPGFFDVVAYTGDGTTGRNIAHNLGVTPELIILKSTNGAGTNWYVNATPYTNWTNGYPTGFLNLTDAITGNTTTGIKNPTSTSFEVNHPNTNTSNSSYNEYIVYLFATLAGISKVGSFSGTGSNVDVDCGFTAGARFVLIKRTDSTGDWYVYDSTRGIVSGNDPYLLLNSTAAEVTSTDYIDPLNSGFTVTSSAPAALNASGGTYIFLAIA